MTFPMLVLKASFLPTLVAVLSRVLFFNMDSDSFSFATVEIIKKLRYIDNILLLIITLTFIILQYPPF